jgi:hypothetical protein
MPPEDRDGRDDQPNRCQLVGWQRPGEHGQPRPVRPRQPRMSPRPLAQGHRELMAQHQDLGVLPPRLPPRQAQHRYGPGDDEEDQLQAHKPNIIARRPEPDLPARHHSRDRADGVPQSTPRWRRFSAPTGDDHCRRTRGLRVRCSEILFEQSTSIFTPTCWRDTLSRPETRLCR